MCGIVGCWNQDGSPVQPSMLDRFTDSIAHRGPDGRGTYIDSENALGFGHRRLAILDISPSGHQPMPYANQRFWMTFNGEIYNFLELREELQGKGHPFHTESDSEVILAAYQEWGEDCQLHFNGMWALAIWDSQERSLFLSRDRFGVKPLYYYWDGKRFAFASETKAFLALDWFKREFDPIVLTMSINDPGKVERLQNSFLQGVKRLPGGHCLLLKNQSEPKILRWWCTLDHLEQQEESLEEQIEHFRELFIDSCRIRMRSDVSIGSCLSGGMDSSSVLCSMAHIQNHASSNGANLDQTRLADNWQKAFVATFPGTVQDERPYAEQVVAHTGADPMYYPINADNLSQDLDQILFQCEEIYFEVCVGPWLIHREQNRKGITVSIDGHGGDEILAGYHHHSILALQDSVWSRPSLNRWQEVSTTLDQMYPSGSPNKLSSKAIMKSAFTEPFIQYVRKQFPSLFSSLLSARRKLRSSGHSSFLQKIASNEVNTEDLSHEWNYWKEDEKRMKGMDRLSQGLYHDFHAGTLLPILRNFDRCSMAHGVEVRSPFLDWRVVCYAFSLPSKVKVSQGFSKFILREAMKGILPEPIRQRTTKLGFASPLHKWFSQPEMKALTLDLANSQGFLKSEIWNGPLIRSSIEKAYETKSMGEVIYAWRFLQAFRLMSLFKEYA